MDRITRLRIRNVRAIESVDLDLSEGITVLIGENGAGKSTILECLEILRKAADPAFMLQFYTLHRGMLGLLRKGATGLDLGLRIEDDKGQSPPIEYSFSLLASGAGAFVSAERVIVGPTPQDNAGAIPLARAKDLLASPRIVQEVAGLNVQIAALQAEALNRAGEPLTVFLRSPATCEYIDTTLHARQVDPVPDKLMLPALGDKPTHPAVKRLLDAMRGIEVHLGFDTLAAWAARTYQRTISVRGPTTHFPASRLDLLGVNLTNAWSELRNRESAHWNRTMDVVRIGLGERVDTVLVPPDMGGGNVYLAVRFKDLPDPVLASDLSDGQIAWLAFVAMTRLNPTRSLLAVDEPDAHLHPFLLGGVLALLQDTAAPVVIATHSDRLLDLLPDPAASVRVCSLDERGRAVVAKVDRAELEKWLAHYGDFGKLRDAGYLSRVLRPSSDPDVERE